MQDIPYKRLSYCKYGTPYRKNTRIWTNCRGWIPLPVCHHDCGSLAEGGKKHLASAQKGPDRGAPDAPQFTTKELYRIPDALCKEICDACLLYLSQTNEDSSTDADSDLLRP